MCKRASWSGSFSQVLWRPFTPPRHTVLLAVCEDCTSVLTPQEGDSSACSCGAAVSHNTQRLAQTSGQGFVSLSCAAAEQCYSAPPRTTLNRCTEASSRTGGEPRHLPVSAMVLSEVCFPHPHLRVLTLHLEMMLLGRTAPAAHCGKKTSHVFKPSLLQMRLKSLVKTPL